MIRGQSVSFWIALLVLFAQCFVSNGRTPAPSTTTSLSGNDGNGKDNKQHPVCRGGSAPLRVCVMVEPSPITYVSGYANRFQALLVHLASRRDEVQVVTAERVHPSPPVDWNGIPVHYTRGMRLSQYPLLTVSTDWTLKAWRVVREMRPDVIHVSSPGLMVFAGLLCSRIFQIPLVVSYHTHLPVYVRSYVTGGFTSRVAEWFVWFLIRTVHSFADLTVVTSPQLQAEFVRHRIPRCEIWQKGIDTDRFHPRYRSEEMRRRMTDNNPDDFLIVYIGRLGSEKRLMDVREVLLRMPENARFCFVGKGPQEAELREYLADFRNRIVFTGELSGEDLSRAFASSDAFCLPSDSETLGFVVLESMASGVPVVGAAAGGVKDLIDDGVTGFLVEPGNASDFSNRLQRLRDDPQLRKNMGDRARREMERWNWESSMAKLRDEQYLAARINFRNRFEQRLWRQLIFFFKSNQTR